MIGADAAGISTLVEDVVREATYKPGWRLTIKAQGGPGHRKLCVFARTPNSHAPALERLTQHQFDVPAGVHTRAEWMRWILDCLLLIEQHEACEFFQVGDRRPFYPHHQDEGSPYELVDRTSEE